MSTWPYTSTDQMISTWPDLRSQLAQGTSDQMATWPKVWPKVKLTWSLILGIHLTNISLTWSLYKCQPDPDPHPDRYIWPNVNLTTYLNWPNHVNLTWPEVSTCMGYIWLNVNLTWILTKCQSDPKPIFLGYIWPNANQTLYVNWPNDVSLT